ncbi:Hypothetical protein R9X50_00782000 [Acrodontium crateriforme]|uniref:Uncharacterized protein n=1 Tax=Acrodontium crateriforme TaxID=150365 RepID=A0AAQ3MCB6_9PEZI|nr:Hypothetical protein R9X50_00782000 [Acrodontium crateriforme]
MYVPSSKWTWAFMLLILLQCIISLAIESYVFGEFQASLRSPSDDPNTPSGALTIPTYLALFIFGFLYQLVLAYDALRAKNTIQIIGICIYNLGMMIYSSVEMDQVNDAIKGDPRQNIEGLEPNNDIAPGTYVKLRPFLIAAPCVIAFFTVLLSLVAWKLYDEFAWTIYKHISADLRLKRRYLQYQIYIALLKFDFFFFLGFTVQFLVVVREGTTLAEVIITSIALPVTIALLFLAAYITRRESYVGQCGIIAVYFAGMAYFVFKLVRMWDSPREKQYAPVRHSLTTFAALTLVLLVVTIVMAFVCMRNFHKGLRPHVQKRKVPDANAAGAYDQNGSRVHGYDGKDGNAHQLNHIPPRMTID